MKKWLLILLLWLGCEGMCDSYLYDRNGVPVYLKLYVEERQKTKLILDYPILVDDTGKYYAVLIKFGHWICPYCGYLNAAKENTCPNKNCKLN